MTFTIGRGNDIVCGAVTKVAEVRLIPQGAVPRPDMQSLSQRLVGKKTADLFADMGAAWSYLLADPQLRWCAHSTSKIETT